MPTSIDKIVDGFPFPNIDPIIGTPDYKSIVDIHLKLNSNAASVQSYLGCGTLGLLFLPVLPVVYATLSTTTFVLPVNPGPEPSIPTVLTSAVISDLRYNHTEATKIFTEYENTDKALRQLLLASIDKIYVQSLCHKYIGYGKTTTRELLDHLYSTYANISASALQDNNKRIRSPYDSNQPFETLIYQVKNAVEYASVEDTPYTPAQVVGIAFQLMFQTGTFNNDCKLWRRQPADVKTWTRFKEFFATDHQEWRESQTTTACDVFQSGNHAYQSANHVNQNKTVEAIANLATATASDRASVAALIATNSTLTADCTATHSQLLITLQDLVTLHVTVADLQKQLSATGILSSGSSPNHYCWTCGTRCDHSS